MALFKIFRGPEDGLVNIPHHDGYAYFTKNSGKLFIDVVDDTMSERIQVNAKGADSLMKALRDGTFQYFTVDDLVLKTAISTVAQGGTGLGALTLNALLVGNGTDTVKMIAINKGDIVIGDETNGISGLNGIGVLYSAAAGEPTFGIAPIAAGGTGANDQNGARQNLDVYSKQEVNNIADSAVTKSIAATLYASGWAASEDVYIYNLQETSIRCGKNGDVPPTIVCTSNKEEYNKIKRAEATAGAGVDFTASSQPEGDIGIVIIDLA